jgi:uncharacterized protein YsxB (DUF464 family)
MIEITVYQEEDGRIAGFDTCGHAGFADRGEDIVCAAVSALVITCINSVETLTKGMFSCTENETDGRVIFRTEGEDTQVQLLLRAFLLGVTQIEEAYSGFVDVIVVPPNVE